MDDPEDLSTRGPRRLLIAISTWLGIASVCLGAYLAWPLLRILGLFILGALLLIIGWEVQHLRETNKSN